ncbi:hypothetical protein B4102_0201 [Heyndrickxia sporothermodurans]|uniref:Uncharacterized protein n=1 Tax=Heyndrickxia sporothermodurans TaxID=46224 RepID=A0A150LH09_9BACI|nr:hypothetical protein B4102_0201 [Heyndrickxia sporothermodurans]
MWGSMAGNRSFKEYVAERFYNKMFAVIRISPKKTMIA